jgi:DNA mismatch repair ATPase MutS
MGCGFYSKSKLKPFKYIHCYLNIPDTSGRDSLFQAEARRCKDIIDIIEDYNYDSHFCVFDELYSGTNPLEAVVSASAFMNYLVKYKNVKCILTTHFIEICKILEKNKYFINYMMNTDFDKDKITFNYTYKLIKGISNIKGGIKVLKDMNYPREIIDNCNSYS